MIGEVVWTRRSPSRYLLSEVQSDSVGFVDRNIQTTVVRGEKWTVVRWAYNYRAFLRDSIAETRDLMNRYRQTGIDAFAASIDSTAFAIWDDEHHRLILIRDLVGKIPIYYTFHADYSFVWANNLRLLSNHADGKVSINFDWALCYAVGIDPPNDSTCLEAHQTLLPGNALTVWRGGHRVDRIERVETKECLTVDDSAQLYREALSSAIQCCAEGTQRRAVSLSGGVDSSIVLAFGMHCTKGQWHAITNYFECEGDSDERSRAEPVAAKLSVPWHCEYLRDEWDWESLASLAIEPDALERAPFTGTCANVARQIGADVTLSGAFGDIMTGAIPFKLPVLIRANRLEEAWLEYERQMGRSTFSRLRFLGQTWIFGGSRIGAELQRTKRILKVHRFNFLGLLAPEVIKKHDLVSRISEFSEKWLIRDINSARLVDDYLKSSVQTGLRAARLAERIAGCPIRHPFLEIEVLKASESVPRAFHLDSLGDRAVVRNATKGIVPDFARLRRDKTSYSGYFDHLRKKAINGAVGQIGGPYVASLLNKYKYFRTLRETGLTVDEARFAFRLAVSGLWLHEVRQCR
jgi:hypothetical protein